MIAYLIENEAASLAYASHAVPFQDGGKVETPVETYQKRGQP